MAVDVHVTNETLKVLKARLAEARTKLSNDGVAMKKVAVYLDQWVQGNFRTRGGKVGGWQPFKYGGRATSKKKANAQSIDSHRWINTSAVLLQDTGHLRMSFMPFIKGGSAGIGSDLPYSAAHESGLPEQGLPQRRMLPTDADVGADVREIMEQHLLVTLKGVVNG